MDPKKGKMKWYTLERMGPLKHSSKNATKLTIRDVVRGGDKKIICWADEEKRKGNRKRGKTFLLKII